MPAKMSKRLTNSTRLINRPASAGGGFVSWKVSVVFIMNNAYEPSMCLSVDLTTPAETHTLQMNSFVAVNLPGVNENKIVEDIIGEPLENLPVYSVSTKLPLTLLIILIILLFIRRMR